MALWLGKTHITTHCNLIYIIKKRFERRQHIDLVAYDQINESLDGEVISINVDFQAMEQMPAVGIRN